MALTMYNLAQLWQRLAQAEVVQAGSSELANVSAFEHQFWRVMSTVSRRVDVSPLLTQENSEPALLRLLAYVMHQLVSFEPTGSTDSESDTEKDLMAAVSLLHELLSRSAQSQTPLVRSTTAEEFEKLRAKFGQLVKSEGRAKTRRDSQGVRWSD
ncbi:MAG: hypothetical protein MHM6MM_003014 [Cercozoa sp. M6MM]